MWDRVGFSNPTFLKSLDYLSLPHHEHSPMRHSKLFCFLLLSYLLFPSEQLFSWLIGIAFFSMTVINQPKKPHTIVHCTVGKVGSKREAENKTAPLSIFCHLLPWDIIMHRQWRRKTIICQVHVGWSNWIDNYLKIASCTYYLHILSRYILRYLSYIVGYTSSRCLVKMEVNQSCLNKSTVQRKSNFVIFL